MYFLCFQCVIPVNQSVEFLLPLFASCVYLLKQSFQLIKFFFYSRFPMFRYSYCILISVAEVCWSFGGVLRVSLVTALSFQLKKRLAQTIKCQETFSNTVYTRVLKASCITYRVIPLGAVWGVCVCGGGKEIKNEGKEKYSKKQSKGQSSLLHRPHRFSCHYKQAYKNAETSYWMHRYFLG